MFEEFFKRIGQEHPAIQGGIFGGQSLAHRHIHARRDVVWHKAERCIGQLSMKRVDDRAEQRPTETTPFAAVVAWCDDNMLTDPGAFVQLIVQRTGHERHVGSLNDQTMGGEQWTRRLLRAAVADAHFVGPVKDRAPQLAPEGAFDRADAKTSRGDIATAQTDHDDRQQERAKRLHAYIVTDHLTAADYYVGGAGFAQKGERVFRVDKHAALRLDLSDDAGR